MADEFDDIHQKVASAVRQSERGKDFKDTDVVTYTRKYNAQYDLITTSDLSAIEVDNVTAYKLIEKAKIWPLYNVEELKTAGNSSGAAYHKVKLRDALSSRPIDSKDARETYVRTVEKLRAGIDACKTTEAVFEFTKTFVDLDKFDFGVIPDTVGKAHYLSTSYTGNLKAYNSRDLQKYFDDIFGKRFSTFCKGSSDAAAKVRTEARIIEAFTPEMEAAALEQRWRVIQNNIATHKTLLAAVEKADDNPKAINEAIRSVEKYATVPTYVKSEVIAHYNQYIDRAEARTKETVLKDLPAYLRARPADWSWAGGKKEKAETAKVDELDKVAKSAETIFEKYGIEDWKKQTKRIPLAYIKRTGGLAVQDIAVNEVVEKFGYRNVVFGNYVNNQERKENLRHFLGAMVDLHEIMNLDVREINKLGGLDINFGSTGCGAFSGAMACYFSQLKAINLTKKSGDGSLAHEWSHYLDNVLGEGTERRATKQNYATYGKEVLNNSEKIKTLFAEYLNWLKTGGGERMFDVRYPAQRKYRFRIVGNTVEEAVAYVQKTYPKYGKYENAHDPDIIKYFGYIAHKLNNNQKITVPMRTRMTDYMAICEQYSGGGDYWNNSKEVFARAFAWFIEDALKQKGRVSNYLVDNKAGMGLAGLLFPESEWPFPYKTEERAWLRDWFDRLFSAIRTEYNVQPFHWNTVERADEYSEYAPDKNAKVEAGVIVNNDGEAEAVGEEIQNFPGGKSFRYAKVEGEPVYQMLVKEKPTKLFIKNTKKVGWQIYAKQDDGTNTKLDAGPFKTLRAAQEHVVENEITVTEVVELETAEATAGDPFRYKLNLLEELKKSSDNQLFYHKIIKNTGGISSVEITDYGYSVGDYVLTLRGIFKRDDKFKKSDRATDHKQFRENIYDTLKEQINRAYRTKKNTEEAVEFFNSLPKLSVNDLHEGSEVKIFQTKNNAVVGELKVKISKVYPPYADGEVLAVTGELINYEDIAPGDVIKEVIRGGELGEVIEHESSNLEPEIATGGTYAKRIQENFAHMGTTGTDWTAVPIVGEALTPGPKGKDIKMPVFDMPKGYKPANTLYPQSNGGPSHCELCSRTPISILYYLQNDKTKELLSVGSECVTHFAEGKSGKENVRDFKVDQAYNFAGKMQNLYQYLVDNLSRMRDRGYGKKAREWSESLMVMPEGFTDNWIEHNAAFEELAPKHLVGKKQSNKETINWWYVAGILPVFIPPNNNGPDDPENQKAILSWYTRNHTVGLELAKEIVAALNILKYKHVPAIESAPAESDKTEPVETKEQNQHVLINGTPVTEGSIVLKRGMSGHTEEGIITKIADDKITIKMPGMHPSEVFKSDWNSLVIKGVVSINAIIDVLEATPLIDILYNNFYDLAKAIMNREKEVKVPGSFSEEVKDGRANHFDPEKFAGKFKNTKYSVKIGPLDAELWLRDVTKQSHGKDVSVGGYSEYHNYGFILHFEINYKNAASPDKTEPVETTEPETFNGKTLADIENNLPPAFSELERKNYMDNIREIISIEKSGRNLERAESLRNHNFRQIADALKTREPETQAGLIGPKTGWSQTTADKIEPGMWIRTESGLGHRFKVERKKEADGYITFYGADGSVMKKRPGSSVEFAPEPETNIGNKFDFFDTITNEILLPMFKGFEWDYKQNNTGQKRTFDLTSKRQNDDVKATGHIELVSGEYKGKETVTITGELNIKDEERHHRTTVYHEFLDGSFLIDEGKHATEGAFIEADETITRMISENKEYRMMEANDMANNRPQGTLTPKAQELLDKSIHQYSNSSPQKKKELAKMVEDQLKRHDEGVDAIGMGLASDFVAAGREFMKHVVADRDAEIKTEMDSNKPQGKKTTIAPGELPKTGEPFVIHMPALGDMPAKDLTLTYDPSNFTFKAVTSDGKKGTMSERVIIDGFAQGMYEWPTSRNVQFAEPGTTTVTQGINIGDEGMFQGAERRVKGFDNQGNVYLVELDEDGKETDNEITVSAKSLEGVFAKFPVQVTPSVVEGPTTTPQDNKTVIQEAYKQLEIRDTPEFKALNDKLSAARRRVRDAKTMADLNAANFEVEQLNKQVNEMLNFKEDVDDPAELTASYNKAKEAAWNKFSAGNFTKNEMEPLVSGLITYPDRVPELLPDYITWATRFPKKYWPNFNVFDVDGHLYAVVKYLKNSNKSLFDLLPPVTGVQAPKPVRFEVGPDNEKCMKFHQKFAGGDELRPVMMGTHFDKHGAVTTDAHYLLFTPYRGDEEKMEGNFCHSKKCIENKNAVLETKYPAYERVIPKDNNIVNINVPALLDYMASLEKWHQTNPVTNFIGLDTGDMKIGFNLERLSLCIKSILELGHKNIQMGYSKPNRGVIFAEAGRMGQAETFKADFVLLMPLMIGGDHTDETAITFFNLETGCITDPNETSFCFDADQNYKTDVQKKLAAQEKEIQELRSQSKQAFVKPEVQKSISGKWMLEILGDDKFLLTEYTTAERKNVARMYTYKVGGAVESDTDLPVDKQNKILARLWIMYAAVTGKALPTPKLPAGGQDLPKLPGNSVETLEGLPTAADYQASLDGAEIAIEFEEDAARKQELSDYIDGLKLLIELA